MLAPDGPAPGLGHRHQRLSQDGAGLAHGGPPRQPGHRAAKSRKSRARRRCCIERVLHCSYARAMVVARRQPADHLAGAVCAPRFGAHAALPARALDHARRRLRRRRLGCDAAASAGRRAAAAAAGAVPRPGRFLAQPLRRGLRRLRRASTAWPTSVPHFRGCSGELNLAPRAYHSGDHEEIGWILARLREQHAGPLLAVGVSLGGNALMRWAGEAGDEARASWPTRWPRSARRWTWRPARVAIGRGFNRLVYTTMFLRSMKPKALAQAGAAPGPVRRAPRCWRRATCTSSTTSSPRRCTAFATPTTTTPALRPSRTCTASAFRRWC